MVLSYCKRKGWHNGGGRDKTPDFCQFHCRRVTCSLVEILLRFSIKANKKLLEEDALNVINFLKWDINECLFDG